MKTIRFSHNYPKLHWQTTAELLAVRPIRIDGNTPIELIDYDTMYHDENGYVRHYHLGAGAYIQLIFLGNLRIPFCTIRKAYPPSKVEYYTAAIGETFAVEVTEPNRGDLCHED